MSSLLVVVKSHLFPQFVHLNQARGKVTAVTSSGHWGRGAPGREGKLRLSITGGRAAGHGMHLGAI